MVSVSVLFFAYLRELVGARMLNVELSPGSTVDDLWAKLVSTYPDLGAHVSSVVRSVNLEYAAGMQELHDGDEVALLPPVSGGTVYPACWITDQPLDPAGITDRATRQSDGGVVTFVGVVRDNAEGQTVRFLEYEAYPEMAVPKMDEIVRTAASKWPGTRLIIVHRIGKLEIGEASVVVVASSPHRLEAFQACQYGIDTLKRSVPIWKKEYFTDGAVWKEGFVPRDPIA